MSFLTGISVISEITLQEAHLKASSRSLGNHLILYPRAGLSNRELTASEVTEVLIHRSGQEYRFWKGRAITQKLTADSADARGFWQNQPRRPLGTEKDTEKSKSKSYRRGRRAELI